MTKKWVIKIEIEPSSIAEEGVGETVLRELSSLRLNEEEIHHLIHHGETTSEVTLRKKDVAATTDFFAFAKNEVRLLRNASRLATAANYTTALRSLRRFHGKSTLPFTKIWPRFVTDYQQWLLERHVCLNSVSNYMRILRAIYNKAVKKNITVQNNPFADVFTGVAPTAKRAIDPAGLRRLRGLNLVPGSELALARDIFLFSFYTRGMPFVDIAYLKREQIEHDTLTYVRRKTKRAFRVKLEKCTLEIVRRYMTDNSPYIFPILTATDISTTTREYRAKACYHNRLLKKLSEMADLDMRLSFYVARHTWASTAFHSGVDMETISRAMGHSSTRITHIYIKSIEEDQMINRANATVIRRIWK